jgi:hypothetical protein
MEYEQFKDLIETIEKVRERSSALYKLDIDLLDFEDSYFKIIDILMKGVFDEEGCGWVDWYLYERIGFNDKVNLATDKNGKEICYDIPSLWEVVKEHLK